MRCGTSTLCQCPKFVYIMLSNNYNLLCQELERQELDAATDGAPFQIYAKLLAIYLYKNELCNAKFLWKRIPIDVKNENPELGLIWKVGQNMWQRNYPGTYAALDREWSESIAPVMKTVNDAVQKRALELIARAYSSISLSDFSLMVGLASEEAAKLVSEKGWLLDTTSNMVQPVKAPTQTGESTSSEDQLYKLTEFVSFLEN